MDRNSRVIARVIITTSLLLTGGLCAESCPLEFDGGASISELETQAVNLLRTLRNKGAVAPEQLGLEIRELGPLVIDRLLITLQNRRLPDPMDPEAVPQMLSEVQSDALLAALDSFGREAVMPPWKERFSLDPDQVPEEPQTIAALDALGGMGLAQDLELVWETAVNRTEVGEDLTPGVATALESAVTGILVRDREAFKQLQIVWARLPESWLDEVIRAVGQTRDPLGLALFDEMLQLSSISPGLVASRIPGLGPSNDTRLNASLAQHLRHLSQAESKRDTQAAVLALGQLEDFSVIPDLIALLEDLRPGVVQSTHRALCLLTGKTLGPTLLSWRRWYMGELSWSKREMLPTLGRLTNRDPLVVSGALKEIARHQLNRHELARKVTPALRAADESVRLMAARVLFELASRWGAHGLIAALADNSEAVRVAAHASLVHILGADRGEQPEDWEQLSVPSDSF